MTTNHSSNSNTTQTFQRSPTTFFQLLESSQEGIPKELEVLQRELHPDQNYNNHSDQSASLLELFHSLCGDFWIDADQLTIIEAVGEGGFGIVEKCRLTLPNEVPKIVAVKRLKADMIHTQEELVEFAEEANLMRKLNCRGLVQLIGLGASNVESIKTLKETVYVVFEFVGGGTLKDAVYRQMISNGLRYEARDALKWGMQIANAMAYLHSCKPSVIHRDLKLENVLLTSGDSWEQKAKVTDLGLHRRLKAPGLQFEQSVYEGRKFQGTVYAGSVLATESSRYLRSQKSRVRVPEAEMVDEISIDASSRRIKDQQKRLSISNSQKGQRESNSGKQVNFAEHVDKELQEEDKIPIVINDATMKVGSYMYMAPEVYNGNIYNEKVDVFSYGVMLHEMMSGKLHVVKIAVTHDGDKVRQYAEDIAEGFREPIPIGWPKGLVKLIEDCWQRDYSKRPSFEEIVVRLDEIYLQGDIEIVDQIRPAKQYGSPHQCGCCGCTIQ